MRVLPPTTHAKRSYAVAKCTQHTVVIHKFTAQPHNERDSVAVHLITN